MADDRMVDCRIRPWADMDPDTLGAIFQKLPLDVILCTVPFVCKAWASVVRGPYSWVEIKHEGYCPPEALDRLLRMLLQRTGDSVRVINIYGASKNTLSTIGPNGKNLNQLHLPYCEIGKSIVQEVPTNFFNLTLLDLSHCVYIGAPVLEAFGKECKLLTTLLRNMHPWDLLDIAPNDDEAIEIAITMPKLKHLELAHSRLQTEGFVQVLESLPDLEFLDVSGCWNVSVKDSSNFLANFSKLKLIGQGGSNDDEEDAADEEDVEDEEHAADEEDVEDEVDVDDVDAF